MKRLRIIKLLYIAFFFAIGSVLVIKKSKLAQDQLSIGAIPDQNPEKLNRLYKLLSSELSESLDVRVRYKHVTNYSAAVTAFRTGDLDLVWFGGLTGVQARHQKKGAQIIAQRDIDAKFQSVFIANTKSGIKPIKNIMDLKVIKGRRFTFGSESSTSGRLMPQYYLQKAGVKLTDLKGGQAGFSGSHDATIALVQSGSYEVGSLNKQVWLANVKQGRVDSSKLKVIWETPPYADYHWLAQPNIDKRFGKSFSEGLKKSFFSFSDKSPRQRKILELFGAKKFIPAQIDQYKEIEQIGRQLGKIK